MKAFKKKVDSGLKRLNEKWINDRFRGSIKNRRENEFGGGA